MQVVGTLSATLSRKLVDALYVEAMVLADEARSYFDGPGDQDRESLDVLTRVSFSCESLRVTTRLMHVIAWLLTRRAAARGELAEEELADPRYALGQAAPSDPAVVAGLPFDARALIAASQDLYARVARLQTVPGEDGPAEASEVSHPVGLLMNRLESAF